MEGSVGSDLKGKRVEQLLEILQIQEKLVTMSSTELKWKFLARLPDRGKSILEFTEKVRLAIAENEELERTGDLLKGDFQAAQSKKNKTNERVEVGLPLANWPPNTYLAEEKSRSPQTINGIAGPSKPSRSRSNKTREIPADHKDNHSFNADSLANNLENIHIKDGVEETNGSAPMASSMQGINPPFLNAAKTKSHYIEVIENRAHSPVKTKEKYKPSKTCLQCIKPFLSAQRSTQRSEHNMYQALVGTNP